MKIMRSAGALIVTLACAGALSSALAQQTPPPSGVFSTAGVTMKGNGLVFMGPGPGADAHMAEMQKRLSDPELRQQLVAETRAQMIATHPDVAEVVGLDERETAALIDLLTDQQMKHLDLFYAEFAKPHPSTPTDFDARTRKFADNETRKTQEIEALLGAERFERYLDYRQTSMERIQVARFDERLAPADKLDAEQKQRLMKIVRAAFDQSIERHRAVNRGMLLRSGTREQMQSALQKNLVDSMENDFREMREDSRALLAELAEFLTPNQVAEYSKMEDEKIASQGKYVEQRRAELGVTPDLEAGPPAAALPERVPVSGKVHLEVYFRTNDAEPVKVAFDTENGKPAPMFDAHEGLWVEMTPLLFQDGWATVEYQCYEERNGQRRKVGGRGGTGSQMADKQPPYEVGLAGGGSTIVGVKAYSIRMDARVSPVP
jgi:hypothetical protein